jgi:hypothetical protein
MWSGFDPRLRRQLEFIRLAVRRSHLCPVREWSLVHVEEHDAVLVIREWPDGQITARTVSVDDLSGDGILSDDVSDEQP